MAGLLDALLWRPPPFIRDPQAVVRLLFVRVDERRRTTIEGDRASFAALSAASLAPGLVGVAAFRTAQVSIGEGPTASDALALVVSPSIFRVLGAHAAYGTLFGESPSDTTPDDRVVLSYGAWERLFNRAPGAVGSRVSIDGHLYTVSGVLPRGFTNLQTSTTDLWLQLGSAGADALLPAEWRTTQKPLFRALARIKAGVSARALQAQTAALLRAGSQQYSAREFPVGIATSKLGRAQAGGRHREVNVGVWIGSMSVLVLLLACANAAILVLARNIARRDEHFVRIALGATEWQLRREVLADVVVAVLPGTVAALVVDYGARQVVLRLLAIEVPLSTRLIDGRATLIVATTVLVAFLAITALSLYQVRIGAIVQQPRPNGATTARHDRLHRRALLSLEGTVCTVLVVFAGLFGKSFRNVESLDLGVDLDRTVEVSLNLPASRPPSDVRAIYERALARLRQAPAIEQAALSDGDPFYSGTAASPKSATRPVWLPREAAYITAVGDGFFASVGARSLRGRDFAAADRAGAPLIAVLNGPLAQYLSPDEDPLGKCIWFDESRTCVHVIGVLPSVWKLSALDREKRVVYVPMAQVSDAVPGMILLRTRGKPESLYPVIRALVQTVAPSLPAASIALPRDAAASEFRAWRIGATVFSTFGLLALAIAGLGVYATASFTMTLRLKEVGIRLALGASRSHVIYVLTTESLVLVGLGFMAGATIILALGRWTGPLLYDTSPADPSVLATAGVILFAGTAMALISPVTSALRSSIQSILRAQ
jgi:predicted permease